MFFINCWKNIHVHDTVNSYFISSLNMDSGWTKHFSVFFFTFTLSLSSLFWTKSLLRGRSICYYKTSYFYPKFPSLFNTGTNFAWVNWSYYESFMIYQIKNIAFWRHCLFLMLSFNHNALWQHCSLTTLCCVILTSYHIVLLEILPFCHIALDSIAIDNIDHWQHYPLTTLPFDNIALW